MWVESRVNWPLPWSPRYGEVMYCFTWELHSFNNKINIWANIGSYYFSHWACTVITVWSFDLILARTWEGMVAKTMLWNPIWSGRYQRRSSSWPYNGLNSSFQSCKHWNSCLSQYRWNYEYNIIPQSVPYLVAIGGPEYLHSLQHFANLCGKRSLKSHASETAGKGPQAQLSGWLAHVSFCTTSPPSCQGPTISCLPTSKPKSPSCMMTTIVSTISVTY